MKTEIKYVADIDLKTFEKEHVLLFLDEEQHPCIFIRNSKEKTIPVIGRTDDLEYKLNCVLHKNGRDFYFHRITCLGRDDSARSHFMIAYDYLSKAVNEPKSDYALFELFDSLEQLFKVTPEKENSKLQIGVYGELLFLLLMYEQGVEWVFDKYHQNFFSKHDLEIDQNNRIEIKSCLGSSRIHRFSHDQLMRTDARVFVVSVLLEKSSEGVSLNELFRRTISFVSNPKIALFLAELKLLCNVSAENPGLTICFEKAKENVRIFEAASLPHLPLTGVDGVTNIKYDVDCAGCQSFDVPDFSHFLKALIRPC